jgi:hypothetical protein
MRFYFPDSQDQIDPSFRFDTEERSPYRVRQRDDRYAHEYLDEPPYRGLLISKAMVDGVTGGAGRYSSQQRQRLYREGVREFFRLPEDPESMKTLGDCGSFSWVRETEAPVSIDEVIDFYEDCRLDAGVSLDHIIFGFESPGRRAPTPEQKQDWERRKTLTLELADAFIDRHRARRCEFTPVGVAQGWNPESYADSVVRLQEMGYRRISIGGMIVQSTDEILSVLRAIEPTLGSDTHLHLLGITRVAHLAEFRRLGVTSFDSTSPFRQAFMDARDNYHDGDRTWVALRVPPLDGARMRRWIALGRVDHDRARRLERAALETLVRFDRDEADVEEVVAALVAYESVHDPGRPSREDKYRDVLEARPWLSCGCRVCRDAGIQVMIFRGSERNKRRGFHNLDNFARRFARVLDPAEDAVTYAV